MNRSDPNNREMMETAPSETEDPWTHAKLLHIYVSPGHDYWGKKGEGRMSHGIRDVSSAECVAGKGIVGDRYYGYRANFRGQVTFFEQAVVEGIRREFGLPKLPASVFRRNFIVTDVRLGDWIGKRFLFQGVEFEGTQECRPCHWMDRVVGPGTEAFMKQSFRGGLRARVVTSGVLRTSGKLNASCAVNR